MEFTAASVGQLVSLEWVDSIFNSFGRYSSCISGSGNLCRSSTCRSEPADETQVDHGGRCADGSPTFRQRVLRNSVAASWGARFANRVTGNNRIQACLRLLERLEERGILPSIDGDVARRTPAGGAAAVSERSRTARAPGRRDRRMERVDRQVSCGNPEVLVCVTLSGRDANSAACRFAALACRDDWIGWQEAWKHPVVSVGRG